jgi:hypothetical protein
MSRFLNPQRTMIQPSIVGDFINKTLALNYFVFINGSGINRKEVEAVINQIIVDKIGVDPEEISPEKSFTDDLGVD